MNRILCFDFICLLCLFTAFNPLKAGAEQKKLTLGGKNGWDEMSVMDGVTKGQGRFGYESIQLDTNSRKADFYTDLLVDFENSCVNDISGNYSVKENSMVCVKDSFMGKGAGRTKGSSGLRLSGKEGSLFGTSGTTGSFLIEFWLKPSIAESGEVIFSWRSSRTIASYPMYQMISASFFSNHIQWNFTNVFSGYTDNNGEVLLEGKRTIIPGRWSHHQVSYDADTGIMEYRVDSELESIACITSNSSERGGSVYSAILGVVADIEICPKFTGLIDDFRIQRSADSDNALSLHYDSYKKDGGRFVTQPLLVSAGASLERLDAEVTEPEQTAVIFYVRSGDNFFNWSEDYPVWHKVSNHSDIEDMKGLYFQLACDLLPDGGGMHTPSVTQIDLTYSEVPLPLPPFTLEALAENSSVTLNWDYSVDDTAGGYYVFYGERPGEYIGGDALEGPSPLNVGNVNSIKLTGLKNGKIYYFAIASYSRLDERISGRLSEEVYARPMER